MKKIGLCLLLMLLLCGCAKGYQQPQGDSADMSGYESLQSDRFVSCTIAQAVEIMESKQTTALFFGYDTCPVCKELVPELNTVLSEKDIRIYYINMMDETNLNDLENIDWLIVKCADYFGETADSERGFPMPCIVYMKNGKLLDVHISTINDRNLDQDDLTERQKARLRYILEKEFDAIIEP